MFLSSIFSDNAYNKELLTLKNFKGLYNLVVNTQSVLDLQTSDLVGYKMECNYDVQQEVSNREIMNTITIRDTTISTENELLKDSLNDITALNKIHVCFKITRNLKGEIMTVRNLNSLIKEWEQAKKTVIPTLFSTANERIGFIYAYEKGLPIMHKTLNNNWQYLLMLPECYHFNHYIYDGRLSKTKENCYKSKFIPQLAIKYHMKGVSFKEKDNSIHLRLKGHIENQTAITVFEQSNPNQPHKYTFEIVALYELDKHCGKVISAQVEILETLNGIKIMNTHIMLKLEE